MYKKTKPGKEMGNKTENDWIVTINGVCANENNGFEVSGNVGNSPGKKNEVNNISTNKKNENGKGPDKNINSGNGTGKNDSLDIENGDVPNVDNICFKNDEVVEYGLALGFGIIIL